MNRHLGESFVDYLKRVTLYLEEDRIGYKEWGDLILGVDNNYTSDNLRKSYYVINKLLPKLDGSVDIDEDDIIRAIQDQKDELYKERCRLQDARREYNKEQRAQARYENLRDILASAFEDIDYSELADFGSIQSGSVDGLCAILCLSDWHYGAVSDSQWNYYDIATAEYRAEQLVNKVKQYCIDLRIKHLFIEINGDMCEGMINISNKVASEEDVIGQIKGVSKLLVQCINSLRPYVQSIKVVTTLGNHGRLCANKKEQSSEKENFEMLIPDFLEFGLGKDVPIITSHGMDIVKYEFDGKVIGVAHGHHDKPASAIENFVKLYKVVPDEIHLAHSHTAKDTNESNIYINQNGSLKGVDCYALGQCRETTKPSQNLIIYGTDRMVVEIICE